MVGEPWAFEMNRPCFEKTTIVVRILALICVWILAINCAAQESGAEAITTLTSHNLWVYVGQAIKFGSGITVIIGVLKAIKELTASGRKNKRIERAAQLALFVRSLASFDELDKSAGLTSAVREQAESEFIEAAALCYAPKVSPSKLRRLFLIYLPPRPAAYVPHFLFFSLCSLACLAIYGVASGTIDEPFDSGWIVVSLELLGLILFMQRWAALEWRRRNGIVLQPQLFRMGLAWYSANTFVGLISNAVICLSLASLLISPLVARNRSYVSFMLAWPAWQRVVIPLVSFFLIPTAYFWSRAENMHFNGEIKPLNISDIYRHARRPRSAVEFVGILALLLSTVWCFVVFSDLYYVIRIGNFPDGEAGTLGIGGGLTITTMLIIFRGIVPWVAIYRGLSDLLDHGRQIPTGERSE